MVEIDASSEILFVSFVDVFNKLIVFVHGIEAMEGCKDIIFGVFLVGFSVVVDGWFDCISVLRVFCEMIKNVPAFFFSEYISRRFEIISIILGKIEQSLFCLSVVIVLRS